MITRRDVRIKVLQFLYKFELGNHSPNYNKNIHSLFKIEFEKSILLFNYILYNLIELCKYADVDLQKRKAKFLPTFEDLNVSVKISENHFLEELKQTLNFKQEFGNFDPASNIDPFIIKSLYKNLINQNFYIEYIQQEDSDYFSEKEIIKKIFYEILIVDENFNDHLEDKFYSTETDAEWILVGFKNYFSSPLKSSKDPFINDIKINFGIQLIETILSKNDYLNELINDNLINWKSVKILNEKQNIESERIALIDKLILKLGISELLYFETIPINVTINEYIDIAKSYSTEQSGKFINGILDKIHLDFKKAGTLHKIDFKSK